MTAAVIRGGHTLDSLDRLTRIAVAMAYTTAMDYTDRYDAAWHAIAEHLYATDGVPPDRDLKLAGANAVNRLAQDHAQTWGAPRGGEFESAARFLRYWELARGPAPSPEGKVVDRVAFAQIWPRLSTTHRQVLTALAVCGDQAGAAELLGKSYATVGSHLRNARRAFLTLWHEHETPSRVWGKTGRGRRTATETLRNRRQQRARRAAA